MIYDAIIIGKGPAGISAALYLFRAGKKILVLGSGIGALEKAELIDNYYGFGEPKLGKELAQEGVEQALRLGVKIQEEEVVAISFGEAWKIKTAKDEFCTKTVLLATGKSRTGLKVAGFEAFRGRGISFCATCDGFFYKNKRLAVIGNGDYAASEFNELLHFTKDVVLLTNGEKIKSNNFPSDIQVDSRLIKSFEGASLAGAGSAGAEEKLSLVRFADGETLDLEGVFVAIGTAGAIDFAAKIGVELHKGDVVVDEHFMTNIPGIFAAGDCIGGFLQVAKAVSDGALAGKSMITWLKNN